MDTIEMQKRIGDIQSVIPALQKELERLLAQLQRECRHPYGIGWKMTTRGLIMTRGEIGCPVCGLNGFVNDGGFEPIPPPSFFGKPIHWITKDMWQRLFDKSTLSERLRLLEPLGLDKPPAP